MLLGYAEWSALFSGSVFPLLSLFGADFGAACLSARNFLCHPKIWEEGLRLKRYTRERGDGQDTVGTKVIRPKKGGFAGVFPEIEKKKKSIGTIRSGDSPVGKKKKADHGRWFQNQNECCSSGREHPTRPSQRFSGKTSPQKVDFLGGHPSSNHLARGERQKRTGGRGTWARPKVLREWPVMIKETLGYTRTKGPWVEVSCSWATVGQTLGLKNLTA